LVWLVVSVHCLSSVHLRQIKVRVNIMVTEAREGGGCSPHGRQGVERGINTAPKNVPPRKTASKSAPPPTSYHLPIMPSFYASIKGLIPSSQDPVTSKSPSADIQAPS
jgi:hypothetical protein